MHLRRVSGRRVLVLNAAFLLLAAGGVALLVSDPATAPVIPAVALDSNLCAGRAGGPLPIPATWPLPELQVGYAVEELAREESHQPAELLPDLPVVPQGYITPDCDPETGAVDWDARRGSLSWLAHHQNVHGFWSAAGFAHNSCRAGALATHGSSDDSLGVEQADSGTANADLAVTSLALLSYIGAGYDHKDGDFKRSCREALKWLRKQQDDVGFTCARGTRDHALATMALCETYGLSGDQVFKPIAESAVQQLLKQRHSQSGWGEQVWGEADMISTTYAILALKTARMSGLEVKYKLPGLGEYLDALADDKGNIRYSYWRATPFGSEREGFMRPPVCAAAWMLSALLTGHCGLNDPRIKACAELLTQESNLPAWQRGRIDLEYWWLGSLAMYQQGGTPWEAWEKAMTTALLDNQRGFTELDKKRRWTDARKLDEHGSWDAEDVWNDDGRVSTTALASLCLEVYYRLRRTYQRLE